MKKDKLTPSEMKEMESWERLDEASETEKILHESDCYIYTEDLMGMPPSQRDLERQRELEEILVNQRKSGKITIRICSKPTGDIIREALKIGISQSDLDVFIENFDGNPYDNLASGPHYDKEKGRLDIDALLNEIFETASAFDNPELEQYFLISAANQIKGRCKLAWPSQGKLFDKRFKERLLSLKRDDTNAETKHEKKEIPSKTEPHVFEKLFIDEKSMKKALDAAIGLGLIEKNEPGFIWSYPGVRSHSICAFWFAMKESGLIKKSIRNNERITGSMRLFFQMESLAKGTLDQVNESSSEYLKLKSNLKKKIADLQQLSLGK